MAATFKLNTREFDRTLREYAKYSRRDFATIVNTKAFYIARRAVVETPKADKAKILKELRGSRIKNSTTKSGKTKQTKYNLAQLLVIAQRAEKGLSTKKKDIKDEVKKFIDRRIQAISFAKAGWLPAVKRLEPLAEKIGGAPARFTKSNSGGNIKNPKGFAVPARESDFPQAKIQNDQLPKGRGGFFSKIIKLFKNADREHLLSIVTPALQKAIDFEEKSMKAYIEKKMRQRAQRMAIRTN